MKRKSMLIVAIILMSIGFAAISTTLVINGNAKVSENQDDFSVIFTTATLDGKDVYSTVVDSTKKIITFETSELKTLNQTSVLNYEVANNSSNYDAEVTVTCVPKTGTQAKYTSIKNKLENDAMVVKAKSSVNGTLTITLDKTSTESVTEEYTCKLEFTATERDEIGTNSKSFADDSWSTIATNVRNNDMINYNIGDMKEVDLGSLGTHTVRIANMSECTTETSETACGFVVEFADIISEHIFNGTSTNLGGWSSSNIKTYLNDIVLKSMPSDLQSIIADTKVISGHGSTAGETNFTTIDKLYLLSTEEIYDSTTSSSFTQYDSSINTSKQLDYYKNIGISSSNFSNVVKNFNGSPNIWWLRSANLNSVTAIFIVDSNGQWSSRGVDNKKGISPAFRIA